MCRLRARATRARHGTPPPVPPEIANNPRFQKHQAERDAALKDYADFDAKQQTVQDALKNASGTRGRALMTVVHDPALPFSLVRLYHDAGESMLSPALISAVAVGFVGT